MTAPQIYSVQDEKERSENLASEEEHSPSLHEQISNVLFELIVQAGSLETLGELMIEASFKQDTACAGFIINQYADLILDRLSRIELILTSYMREGTE